MFHNDRSQGFTEVTAEFQVGVPKVSTRQISWIDYDNNGTLDLFVADRVGANLLFSNNAGKFVEVGSELGIDDSRATVGACWFDYNQDGLLDLFLANQGTGKDALYRNNGKSFTDVAGQLSMEGGTRERGDGGVDCSIADFDNDGNLDLFVATYNPISYIAIPATVLSLKSATPWVSQATITWSALVGAIMITMAGSIYLWQVIMTMMVYARHMIDCSKIWAILSESGISKKTALNGADHGVQWADFDADGDLDLSMTEGYNIAGRHPLVRNELSDDLRGASLSVSVSDHNGVMNRAGAEVRIFNQQGQLLGLRLVTTGDGYNSHSNLPVHLGLPNVDTVDIEVTFFDAFRQASATLSKYKDCRLSRQIFYSKPAIIH